MRNEKELTLRVGRVWYPVTCFGSGKKLGVWVKGCTHRCPGCISRELWQDAGGVLMTARELLDRIPQGLKPDGLVISGGEPMNQPEAVLELAALFQERYGPDILLYTGYTLEEVRSKGGAAEKILDYLAVLVDGRYQEEQNRGIGLMGSENQTIHRFGCEERYEGAERWERAVQCVMLEDRFWLIGVPPLEFLK